MKFKVQGVDYDLSEIVNAAAIGDIRTLKKLTKGMDAGLPDGETFQGVTPKTFSDLFISLQERADELTEAGLLSDDGFLIHMQALIWLTKRQTDWTVPWEAADGANRVKLNEFQFVPDVEDAPAVEDPKVPAPDSDPVENPPSPQTLTTSSSPSTPGFPSSPTSSPDPA